MIGVYQVVVVISSGSFPFLPPLELELWLQLKQTSVQDFSKHEDSKKPPGADAEPSYGSALYSLAGVSSVKPRPGMAAWHDTQHTRKLIKGRTSHN